MRDRSRCYPETSTSISESSRTWNRIIPDGDGLSNVRARFGNAFLTGRFFLPSQQRECLVGQSRSLYLAHPRPLSGRGWPDIEYLNLTGTLVRSPRLVRPLPLVAGVSEAEKLEDTLWAPHLRCISPTTECLEKWPGRRHGYERRCCLISEMIDESDPGPFIHTYSAKLVTAREEQFAESTLTRICRVDKFLRLEVRASLASSSALFSSPLRSLHLVVCRRHFRRLARPARPSASF